jgi:MFS family permease
MTALRKDTSSAPASVAVAMREERRAAGVACGAHALHDGYTDLIYLMLPVWQAEFGLSYAQLGMLRGIFAGSMAALQIPSGWLGERLGTAPLLAAGTAVVGLSFCLAGLSSGVAILAAALLIGGIGASTQHPLAAALVARAFAGSRSLKALGTYNFAGDIGKMTLPAAAGLLLLWMPWRPTLALLGALGIGAAAFIFVLTPRFAREPESLPAVASARTSATEPRRRRLAFPTLFLIGVFDSSTRMAFLTFLPFLLLAKGASVPTIGLALTLVFAGGAAGKLFCAFVGARLGVVATVWLTEGLTTVTILALLPLPLEASLVLLPIVGVALNGTSSVLYGSVPELVEPARRMRAFGIFYTGTIGAGAVAPALYGLLGDALGVPAALVVVACSALVTLPLAAVLRPVFAARP